MKIRELISALEVFAAPELQEEYDNAGLITGNASWECRGVLCALDVTPEVIKEAIGRGCNLVVAHHPIVFKGLKRLNGKSYIEQVVIDAIKSDIAIYACHTNLDNVVSGVNHKMAEKLELKNGKVLAPKTGMLRRLITFAPLDKAEEVRNAVFAAGAGHIGQYSECSFNSEGTGTFKAEKGADPYVGEVGKQHQERESLPVGPGLHPARHEFRDLFLNILNLPERLAGCGGAGIRGFIEEARGPAVELIDNSVGSDFLRLET